MQGGRGPPRAGLGGGRCLPCSPGTRASSSLPSHSARSFDHSPLHPRLLPLQAFQPALQRACAQHPEALFLAVAVQPGEAAAAAAPASLAAAAAAAAPSPAPGTPAERVELLQGLAIAALPCTLLMRDGRLLDRLQLGGSSAGGAAASTPAAAAKAAAGAAARLRAAIQAAQQEAAAPAP